MIRKAWAETLFAVHQWLPNSDTLFIKPLETEVSITRRVWYKMRRLVAAIFAVVLSQIAYVTLGVCDNQGNNLVLVIVICSITPLVMTSLLSVFFNFWKLKPILTSIRMVLQIVFLQLYFKL